MGPAVALALTRYVDKQAAVLHLDGEGGYWGKCWEVFGLAGADIEASAMTRAFDNVAILVAFGK